MADNTATKPDPAEESSGWPEVEKEYVFFGVALLSIITAPNFGGPPGNLT